MRRIVGQGGRGRPCPDRGYAITLCDKALGDPALQNTVAKHGRLIEGNGSAHRLHGGVGELDAAREHRIVKVHRMAVGGHRDVRLNRRPMDAQRCRIFVAVGVGVQPEGIPADGKPMHLKGRGTAVMGDEGRARAGSIEHQVLEHAC